jgi:hypothetical protein
MQCYICVRDPWKTINGESPSFSCHSINIRVHKKPPPPATPVPSAIRDVKEVVLTKFSLTIVFVARLKHGVLGGEVTKKRNVTM